MFCTTVCLRKTWGNPGSSIQTWGKSRAAQSKRDQGEMQKRTDFCTVDVTKLQIWLLILQQCCCLIAARSAGSVTPKTTDVNSLQMHALVLIVIEGLIKKKRQMIFLLEMERFLCGGQCYRKKTRENYASQMEMCSNATLNEWGERVKVEAR